MVRERSWHKAASKRALSGEGSLKRRLRFWLPHEATLGEIVAQWWWGCLKKSLPVLTSICRGCLTLEVSRKQREDSCHVIQPGIDVHRGTRWDHTLISQLQGPACFLTSTSSEREGGELWSNTYILCLGHFHIYCSFSSRPHSSEPLFFPWVSIPTFTCFGLIFVFLWPIDFNHCYLPERGRGVIYCSKAKLPVAMPTGNKSNPPPLHQKPLPAI